MNDYLSYYERMKQHGIEADADAAIIAKMNENVLRGTDENMTISANSLIHDHGFNEDDIDGAVSELRGYADSNTGNLKERFLRFIGSIQEGTIHPGKDSVRSDLDKLFTLAGPGSALQKVIPGIKALAEHVTNDSIDNIGRLSVELDAQKAKLVGLSDANRSLGVNSHQQSIHTINDDAGLAIDIISAWDGTGNEPAAYGA